MTKIDSGQSVETVTQIIKDTLQHTADIQYESEIYKVEIHPGQPFKDTEAGLALRRAVTNAASKLATIAETPTGNRHERRKAAALARRRRA